MKKKVKSLDSIIETITRHGRELEERYKIKSLKIFGSYVEGANTEKSDLDIIVEFSETPTLIEFVRIEEELSNLLGVKVDLLTENSISPYIKPYIKAIEILW